MMARPSDQQHISSGTLRALLDDELAPDERAQIQAHLAICPECQSSLAGIREQAIVVSQAMQLTKSPVDARSELRRFRNETSQQQSGGWIVMKRRMTQVWRPAIALIATVTLLVGVYSFAPTRALAREFLSIFRAENLAVVEIDADTEQINAAMEQVGTLLEGIEPSETIDGSAQVVETVEEASQLAGFEVRMPSQLLGNPLLSIEVKGPDTATFKVSREILGQFLALAGMDPARLPDGFEQGMANIEMPGTVMMEGNNWTLVQALSPVITYPSDIDPQVLGEAGFRLLGMSEKDARRISREIDWTTTLIMPMPRDLSELREVEVAGETAILVSTTRKTDQATDKSLMWEKDGVLNMLSFPGSTERLLKIAESLY